MRFVLTTVFAFLLVLSTSTNAKPRAEADAAEVKKVLGDYKSALERLDLNGVEQLFAKDNQVIESGKVEGSYADYLAHHIGPELGHFQSFKFSDYKVSIQIQGDIAWSTETYRYTIVLKEDAKVIERQGVATSVLRRTGKAWKIVSTHSSSRTPKPMTKP